jgi:hypothetical protein
VAAHVDDNPALGLDLVERGIQLWSALALERSEDLTGEALGVHANQGTVLGGAADDREVVGPGHPVAVGAEAE